MKNCTDALTELKKITEQLVSEDGCPWDRVQTHESLKPYLIEETYEVLDAIDEGCDEKLKEELGDHLFQAFLHAAIRKKNGGWDISDVAAGHVQKLIRRHPHVFGDTKAATAEEALGEWNRIKQEEKGGAPKSILKDEKYLPGLLRAYKIKKQAIDIGFTWETVFGAIDKVKEELEELKEACELGDADKIEDELGDVLMTVVSTAVMVKTDPESALSRATKKFVNRFRHIEENGQKDLQSLSPDEWQNLWQEAKKVYP